MNRGLSMHDLTVRRPVKECAWDLIIIDSTNRIQI